MTYPDQAQAESFVAGPDISHMYDHKTGALTTEGEALIVSALELLQAACWQVSEDHGFHEEGGRDFGLVTALLHSEISEAFESYRANEPDLWFNDKVQNEPGDELAKHPDPYNPDGSIRKAEGIFAEWADEIIRLGDSAEERVRNGAHASLAEAVIFKFRYNLTRPYKHGKVV